MRKPILFSVNELTEKQIEYYFNLVCNEKFSVFRVNSSKNWVAINAEMREIAEIITVSAEINQQTQFLVVEELLEGSDINDPRAISERDKYLSEIKSLAKAIVAEAVLADATHFYCVGEPTLTMWANLYAGGVVSFSTNPSPYGITPNEIWSNGEGELFHESKGEVTLLAITSTTVRKSVEVTNPDGTVTKTDVFSHVQWREMF